MSQLPIELRTALTLKEHGHYSEAERLCREFLSREPKHAEGHFVLGTLLHNRQCAEEALMEFQQALSQSPSNGDYWIGFTQTLLDLNRPGDAFRIIDDLINKGLDWPAAIALRERAHNAINLASKKLYFFIDIVGLCNLRCPSCPMGNSKNIKKSKKFMSTLTFEKILKKASSECNIQAIALYNWGEPFLHKNLPDFVRIAKGSPVQRSDSYVHEISVLL